MKCPNKTCQADNPNDARFCHMCGGRMPRKNTKKWVLLIILLLVIYFLIFLISSLFENSYYNYTEFETSEDTTKYTEPIYDEPIDTIAYTENVEEACQ